MPPIDPKLFDLNRYTGNFITQFFPKIYKTQQISNVLVKRSFDIRDSILD